MLEALRRFQDVWFDLFIWTNEKETTVGVILTEKGLKKQRAALRERALELARSAEAPPPPAPLPAPLIDDDGDHDSSGDDEELDLTSEIADEEESEDSEVLRINEMEGALG